MIFHSTTKQGFLIHMYKNPIADCCRRGIERDADFGIVFIRSYQVLIQRRCSRAKYKIMICECEQACVNVKAMGVGMI
jgi:hypothetical protein